MSFRRYELHATLTGSQDAVVSLSFSVDGEFLASTGYGGVIIYQMRNLKPIPTPSKYMTPKLQERNHIIVTSTFVYFESTRRHVLVLGALDGDLIAWNWNSSKRAFEHWGRGEPNTSVTEILSMDVYEQRVGQGRYAYIAVSRADRSMAVWRLSSHAEFMLIFTILLDAHTIPKTVRFDEKRNVLVFAWVGGEVLRLDRKSGEVLSKKNCGLTRIGTVVVDFRADHMVVCTGKNFQAFSLSDLKHEKTLECLSPPVVTYPRQLTFIEDGSWVVGGTDSGSAIVFDLNKGKIEESLAYPKGGLVQIIETFDGDGWKYVAIAGSTPERAADVILFRKKTYSQSGSGWSLFSPSMAVLLVIAVVLLSVFEGDTMWYRWNAFRLQYESGIPSPQRIIDLQDAEYAFTSKSGKTRVPQPRIRIVQGNLESSSSILPENGGESHTEADSAMGKLRSEL